MLSHINNSVYRHENGIYATMHLSTGRSSPVLAFSFIPQERVFEIHVAHEMLL